VASIVVSLFHSFRFLVRSRASLHVEIVALRHQLAVVNRSRRPQLRFTTVDRVLWAWLSQRWHGRRAALMSYSQRPCSPGISAAFRLFWTGKSRHRTGRPRMPADVRALIRETLEWRQMYLLFSLQACSISSVSGWNTRGS